MVDKNNNIPFKIVGLIASVIAILACFVAAVTWVSMNMADNSISIDTLKQGHLRHELLISKNAEILSQHAQLLAILDQHDSSLKILTNFMTQGGRFTEDDGNELDDKIQEVKERLHHYEILETELGWIKKSIGDLEGDIKERFDNLTKQLDKLAEHHP